MSKRSRRNRQQRQASRTPQIGQALGVEAAIRRWDELHASSFGNLVSVRNSYQLSAWVYSAISIITDWTIRNPFIIENNGIEVTSGPLWNLTNRPNQYEQQNTSVKHRTAYLTELMLSGAVMRVFTKMDGIEPREMAAFPRQDYVAEWNYDEHGVRVVQTWRHTGRVSTRYVPGDDIHHDALYNPYDSFEGLAPLTAAVLGITADVNLGELLAKFFENDASTGLIMATDEPLSSKQIEEAIASWEKLNQGTQNAYRTKFIGHGLKPHRVGADFDASVQRILKVLSRDEIMNGIFRIPPIIYAGQMPVEGVQIGSRTSEPEKEMFLLNVIMLWADRYDTEFNRDIATRFGPGYRGRHNFRDNPILERRRLERAKAVAELIDRGVTLNHVIEWLSLELSPEPHGDEFWVPAGTVPASVVMKAGEKALMNIGGRPPESKKKTEQWAQEHIDKILQTAQTVATKEAARENGRDSGVNRITNSERIMEILGCSITN